MYYLLQSGVQMVNTNTTNFALGLQSWVLVKLSKAAPWKGRKRERKKKDQLAYIFLLLYLSSTPIAIRKSSLLVNLIGFGDFIDPGLLKILLTSLVCCCGFAFNHQVNDQSLISSIKNNLFCMRKPHNIDRYLQLSVTNYSKIQKQLSGVTFNFNLEY